MRNFKATLAYDGTDFHGWQVQPDRPTIQGTLKSVLAEIEGAPVDVQGAGRTDAGVHALGQVASFSLTNPIPAVNLRQVMNSFLPPAIRVSAVAEAEPDFHARHCARAKLYEYRIFRGAICPPFDHRYVHHHPYPLDETAMTAAAAGFQGKHDFAALAAAGGDEKETTIRTIFSSTIERQGTIERQDELVVYRVRGTGFLYRMVRNIVGTLIEVGRGRLAISDIDTILAGKQRSQAGPTAPAKGLFLVRVEYGE